MTNNPYLVESPCLISFSGGRTSAYMLYHILKAYNGHLPEDIFLCFANTGKERPETLDFIASIGERWNVKIYWLEYRDRQTQKDEGFEIVNYYNASRSGEPFAHLIRKKQMLPNVVTRYCTEKLKIETMQAFMRCQGIKEYYNAVGLRFDEPHRIHKNKQKTESLQMDLFEDESIIIKAKRKRRSKSLFHSIYPLYEAKVTKRDVMEFWQDNKQGFDLQLKSYQGNCDLCFLKGQGKLIQIMHEKPELSVWWQEQEKLRLASKPAGAQFIKDVKYSQLQYIADHQADWTNNIDDFETESTIDCFCTD